MFDVIYLYLFLDAYLIYIKGIIVFIHKKNIYPKNPSKYFCIYLSFKEFFISKKKTKIYNSYHKLIWLSSYEKKKTYFKLLKLKKKILIGVT